MKKVKEMDNQLYIETSEILRIANRAVQKALAENKKLGIPQSFVKNGKVYYSLEDGTITDKLPENEKEPCTT